MNNPASPIPPPATGPTPAGLLIIDKPKGPTSMSVCANIRARLRRAGAPKRIKVGHAGTLDPMATGVLVVLVGKATRFVARYMGERKGYDATIDLAHTSPTDDAEAELVPVAVQSIPSREQVQAAIAPMVGVIMQRPPAYSAILVEGQRAYDLARRGRPPELPARPVHVHSIIIRLYRWPLLDLSIECGKGTYIRALARDLGAALSAGGVLTALRRTFVGDCTIDRATPLDSLPFRMVQDDLLPAE